MDLLARYPPSQIADTDSIWLIRGDPRNPQRYRVNLDEIQELGVTTTNYVLREDDIIYIPPTMWGSVGLWLDEALYPVRVVVNTFGLLFRAVRRGVPEGGGGAELRRAGRLLPVSGKVGTAPGARGARRRPRGKS
jgi:hypothetical protein